MSNLDYQNQVLRQRCQLYELAIRELGGLARSAALRNTDRRHSSTPSSRHSRSRSPPSSAKSPLRKRSRHRSSRSSSRSRSRERRRGRRSSSSSSSSPSTSRQNERKFKRSETPEESTSVVKEEEIMCLKKELETLKKDFKTKTTDVTMAHHLIKKLKSEQATQIEELNKEKFALLDKIQEKQKEVDSEKEKYAQLKRDSEQLKNAVNITIETHNDLKKREEEVKQLNAEMTNLRCQLVDQQPMVCTRCAELENIRNSLTKEKSDHAETKRVYKDNRTKLQSANADLTKVKDENKDLKALNESLKMNIEKLKLAATLTSGQNDSYLNQKVERMENQMNERVQDLQKRLDEEKSIRLRAEKSLDDQKNKFDKDKNEWETKYKTAKTNKRNGEKKIVLLGDMLRLASSELPRLKKSLCELRCQMIDTNAYWTSRVERLKIALCGAVQNRTEIKQEFEMINETFDKCKQLKEQAEWYLDENNRLNGELDEFETVCAEIHATNNEYKEQIESLEKQVSDLREQVPPADMPDTTHNIEDLERQLEVLRNYKETLERNKAKSDDDLKSFKNKAENDRREAEEKVRNLINQIHTLQDNLERVNKENQQLNTKLKGVEKCQSQNRNLIANLERLQKEKEDLNMKQNIVETQLHTQIRKLQANLERLQKEKEVLNTKQNAVETELQTQIRKLQANLERLQKEKEELSCKLNGAETKLQTQASVHRTALECKSKDIHTSSAECQGVKRKAENLQADLLKKEVSMQKLTAENTQLKSSAQNSRENLLIETKGYNIFDKHSNKDDQLTELKAEIARLEQQLEREKQMRRRAQQESANHRLRVLSDLMVRQGYATKNMPSSSEHKNNGL